MSRPARTREPRADTWRCEFCNVDVRPGQDDAGIYRHIKSAAHLVNERQKVKYRELMAGKVSPYIPPPMSAEGRAAAEAVDAIYGARGR